jgi:hypothetical protein
VFELRLAGLPGVLETWGDRYRPVLMVEDSILETPPPPSDGGGVPAAVIDPSSGEVYTFCGERWVGLLDPGLPVLHSGDDVPCESGISVGKPSATGTLGRFGWTRDSRGTPSHRGGHNAVRPSRRDQKGEAKRGEHVGAGATLSHPAPHTTSNPRGRTGSDKNTSRAELTRLSHLLSSVT